MDQVTLFHRILHKIVQKYTKSLFGGIFYIYRKFLNCVKKNSLNIKDLKIENSKVVSPNTVSPNTETPNTRFGEKYIFRSICMSGIVYMSHKYHNFKVLSPHKSLFLTGFLEESVLSVLCDLILFHDCSLFQYQFPYQYQFRFRHFYTIFYLNYT